MQNLLSATRTHSQRLTELLLMQMTGHRIESRLQKIVLGFVRQTLLMSSVHVFELTNIVLPLIVALYGNEAMFMSRINPHDTLTLT